VLLFHICSMDKSLQSIFYNSLLDLETEDGINASGRDEIFGCIFGRDTAMTVLKILNILKRQNQTIDHNRLIDIARKALLGLTALQGKEVNLESGEEPGKFIHEYRKDRFEHLTAGPRPWYIYPDGKLRNYDSLDATPLALIAISKFFELTGDKDFLEKTLPSVEKGLDWLQLFGDLDNDHLLEYELSAKRKFGGLLVQSWTDSFESLARTDGTFPPYPIAPVEIQGYAWLALKLWGKNKEAEKLKVAFNNKFLFKDGGLTFAAQALDGEKKQITTLTGNPLLLLWASHNGECILKNSVISDIVKRTFMPDLFDEGAGIRTMSSKSATYNPNSDSYHNGSFWPILNGLVYEGLANWDYFAEANRLKTASLAGLSYYQTPIELYTKGLDGNFYEYKNILGQTSCKKQAWSAAAGLDFLTE